MSLSATQLVGSPPPDDDSSCCSYPDSLSPPSPQPRPRHRPQQPRLIPTAHLTTATAAATTAATTASAPTPTPSPPPATSTSSTTTLSGVHDEATSADSPAPSPSPSPSPSPPQLGAQCQRVLRQAVRSGDSSGLRRLLEAREGKVNLNVFDAEGQTVLHESCQLGNLQLVKLLVRFGADVRLANRDGWSAVHIAAFGGHTDILLYLMQATNLACRRS